ncbi:hypothetical protein NEF87_002114 [Candidatus Lokiarchaeum ossiferum]|uniref:Uncharacterized protein n=1 Tax=Candidatus Lokiarchaeum ossiferum TaxID=2951803 RepID=A0ABY6HTF6_9ARCH|nr:hypothetical protein NEF87_002114 [Candidatus Lokiarchaeum sp. B-35]
MILTVFDGLADNWKNFWSTLDYVAFWGWILLVLGVIFLFLLIFFTEFKRPERDSVKFTSIVIIIAAALMGIGLHMVLTAGGLW